MRNVMIATAVVLISVSGGLAEVLFLGHYDDLNAPTLEGRLTADYAVGNPVPTDIIQSNGAPDVQPTSKFGAGSLRVQEGFNDAPRLFYSAPGNFNPQKGSFEFWSYLTSNSREYAALDFSEDGDGWRAVITPYTNKFRFAIATGGTSHTIESDDSLTLNTWVHMAMDWKLDAENSTENYFRLWIDGVKKGEIVDVPGSLIAFEGDEIFALGSKLLDPPAANTGWRGWMDDVRFTSDLVSDLYSLDNDDNFTPPTSPLLPEPATMGILVIGSVLTIRRRR